MAQPAPDRWVEVSVEAAAEDFEMVAALLHEFAEGGVSIEPAIRTSDDADFAYELLDAPGTVRAYLAPPAGEDVQSDLRRRLEMLPVAGRLGRIEFRDVQAADWAEEWKRFYHPMRIGERLLVAPSWEDVDAAPGDLVIRLDPGTAFGTGQHETTRLCLEALERAVRPGSCVLDLGAGSGVLAIAAAKLGARAVLALDIDADTVPVAEENARMNGVEAIVRHRAGSLGEAWPASEPPAFDVVVANISSTVLVRLMEALRRAVRPGGTAILSGFVEEGAALVRAAAADAGFAITAATAEADWRCLTAGPAGAPRT